MNYNFYPRNDVLCIDMRSFYASIEAVRLGLDPMKVMLAVVGDTSRPGSIVLAASPTLKKKHGISNVSRDRKSTRLNSSHVSISYAVFCLKKKKPYQAQRVDL